jgi:ABC-type nitrate/sulfonate/bicarbonate transport system substrate-binding protein
MMIRRCARLLALALPLLSPALPAAAQAPKEIAVVSFAGGFNLPLWVADKQGFFAREGLAPKISYTPRSTQLITDMVAGKVQVAMLAVDNVVAYREGQGEAPVPADFDITAVMGSDSGFLAVIAVPEIRTPADLKGRLLAVDAMTTGFAFMLREVVARAGLSDTDVRFVAAGGTDARFAGLMDRKFDATITRAPFDAIAVERGFSRVLTVAEAFGAYQGPVAAIRAGWGRENRAAVVGYIRAYKAAVDWLADPAHRPEALAILAAGEPALPPAQVAAALDVMTGPGGFHRDLRIDAAGFAKVLELRSKYAVPEKSLTEATKYIDPGYLREALAR